uniref:DUF1618 domain-containing protein n=1 Tax=Oryza nivara TaxID=4536 RepID=A0A0E0GMN0_ORYNI
MEARRPKGRRSPPDLVHGWIILDRFVHSSDGDVDAADDVTASEIALTCSGRRVRASLCVADPPAVSRLRIHRLDQPWPDAYILRHAQVVAAHRGSILFWARVPFADDEFVVPGYFPVDYFVYTAGASGAASSSLTRLPPCFIGGAAPDDEDHYFKPYRKQHQRIMLDENVGFLSGDSDGEFTVADITIVDCTSLTYASSTNHHERWPSPVHGGCTVWRCKQMRRKLSKWVNDVVLPLHDGRHLCLVDYYRGILLVDAAKELRHFRYIPLPEEAMMHGCRHYEEDDPDPARCASATCAGSITLVCIYNGSGRKKNKSASPATFIIKSWTLIDIHKCIWLHDFTMEADEFWSICARENERRLPLVTPSFPVDGDNGLYWLVEVDMRNKAMISPAALYINEEEEEDAAVTTRSGSLLMAITSSPAGSPLICTRIPSRVQLVELFICRQLSQMMQKTKYERTMHKIAR